MCFLLWVYCGICGGWLVVTQCGDAKCTVAVWDVWCQKAGDRLISCAASGKTTPLTALPMMITDHHPDNNHQDNHHPDGYREWSPCEFS